MKLLAALLTVFAPPPAPMAAPPGQEFAACAPQYVRAPIRARPIALEAGVEALASARAFGANEAEALIAAMEAVADAHFVRQRGRGVARVTAKDRRRLTRLVDALRAEALFEARQ